MPKEAAAPVLDPDTPSIADVDAGFRVVSIAVVRESPLNPRQRQGDVSDLVASIREHGIIEPLVVRVSRDGDQAAGYELVAGSRRLRAAREAGLVEVPVLVRALTDLQLLEIALAENVHRASMTPMEEARALARVAELDAIYRDPRVLASKIGRSESYVRDRLRLLRLNVHVQAAVDADAITLAHADRIARLPADQQFAALEHCFSELLLPHEVDGVDEPSIEELIVATRWDILRPTLQSVADLERYIAAHATLDATAPEVQQALRPALEEIYTAPQDEDEDDLAADYRQATEELPRLSSAGGLSTKEAVALGVLPALRWIEIGEKERDCGHAVAGLVVHGYLDDGWTPLTTPRLVRACLFSSKCPTHWPPAQKAAKNRTPKVPDWKAAAERREREQKAWQAELEQLKPFIVAHASKATLSVKLLQHAMPELARSVQSRWGVNLSEKTIAQALALKGLSTFSRQEFQRSAKAIGFDAKAASKAIMRQAKDAASAPAPTKKGAKARAKKARS